MPTPTDFTFGVRGAFSGLPIATFRFASDAELFLATIDPNGPRLGASFEIYGLTPEAAAELELAGRA